MNINKKTAVENLMSLLAAEGPSGGEGPVAQMVTDKLLAAGCKPQWIKYAGKSRLPKHFTIGNLIVKIPGTIKAPRIMFSAHLDTVPICQGAVPVIKGNRIVPKGNTALGGDDRSSVAALVSMAEAVLKNDLLRPPLTLLFTVGEENGLHGAKAFNAADGGNPAMCFNLDGSGERDGVIGALGAVRWRAEIRGKSVHAAVNPEGGISTALIAAQAISKIKETGYFGQISKGRMTGTANIGSLNGGKADNQVMDKLTVTGECRSHNPAALEQITSTYRKVFEQAARDLKNNQGECGAVEFIVQNDYRSFKLKKSGPVVQRYLKAAPLAGRKADVQVINAGLDANILNEKGIPTVTFDAGNHNAHDLNESVDIPRYLQACELALAIVTLS